MSTLPQLPPPASGSRPMAAEDDYFWRISVEQYHAMIDQGILRPEDPVELLAGLLVRKMPKNSPHSGITRLLRKVLSALMPGRWFVDTQEPVTTLDSEPEPDLLVIRGDESEFLDAHPTPAQVGLLVEVAASSLARDRTVKKPIYANAGIATYWIVNIAARTIETYSDPTGATEAADYRHCEIFHVGDNVPVVLDGVTVGHVAVASLFPQ